MSSPHLELKGLITRSTKMYCIKTSHTYTYAHTHTRNIQTQASRKNVVREGREGEASKKAEFESTCGVFVEVNF